MSLVITVRMPCSRDNSKNRRLKALSVTACRDPSAFGIQGKTNASSWLKCPTFQKLVQLPVDIRSFRRCCGHPAEMKTSVAAAHLAPTIDACQNPELGPANRLGEPAQVADAWQTQARNVFGQDRREPATLGVIPGHSVIAVGIETQVIGEWDDVEGFVRL